MYLVVDGGAELNKQETAGNNRKDTQDGGEEDGQPDVGLVQRVSGCSWKNTHIVRLSSANTPNPSIIQLI